MNYETFEIILLKDLETKNKKCIKKIEENSELISNTLGENGKPEIRESFLNKLSNIILQNESKKIFELIGKVLSHPLFEKVLSRFRETDILIRACKDNKKDVVKWLLTMDINSLTRDEDGRIALMYSVQNISLNFASRQLLSSKNQQNLINIEDKNGETVLFHALRNKEILLELINSSSIDINHFNRKKETALLYACKNDIFEAIPILTLNNDINVNLYDEDLQTPAMILVSKCRDSELRKLNMRNCHYDYINKKGESVLSTLIKFMYLQDEQYRARNFKNYINILTFLVHLNSNLNIPVDEDENTLIMVLLLIKDYMTLEYVMKFHKGIDLSIKNRYGENASSLCLKCKDFKNPKLFIKYPTFDYDYVDDNGNTMLMLCAANNLLTVIKEVIENDVNMINSCNHRNENALIIASKLNCNMSIGALLWHPIYVNQQDWIGNTALHYAVDNENLNIVKCLVEAKADIHIKNNEGLTPVDMAKEKKNDSLLECLLNNNKNNSSSSKSKNKSNSNSNSNLKASSSSLSKYEETVEFLQPYMNNRYADYIIPRSIVILEKKVYGEKIYKINVYSTSDDLPNAYLPTRDEYINKYL